MKTTNLVTYIYFYIFKEIVSISCMIYMKQIVFLCFVIYRSDLLLS